MTKYPQGKLNDDDEGALLIAMAIKDKTLIIDFGKPTHWIGLPKDQAIVFSKMILEAANKIPESH